VLYSFPHPIGAPGIGTTAMNQVRGLVGRGVEVTLFCTSVARDLPDMPERVTQTLSVAGRRIPHRVMGVDRAYRYHDWRVSRALADTPDTYDLVHAWPMGSLQTFAAARREGLAAARESPNCYTAVAYELALAEATQLGLTVPTGASHHFDAERLAREQQEYELATVILAPSDFVARSYERRPGRRLRILRHSYGFDVDDFPAPSRKREHGDGLRLAFVGSCEPRKGLHYALEAWHSSGVAANGGRLVICGRWDCAYREFLEGQLHHPSIEVRSFTDDVGALLRGMDALVLPSVEEGSALVTYEAQASGCALLVSDAAGALAENGVHGFIHRAGDVAALAESMRRLSDDPELLARQRAAVLDHRDDLTWAAAAARLEEAYRTAVALTEP
jgi:glycosyltransferase involved in cell wall biosynthesis